MCAIPFMSEVDETLQVLVRKWNVCSLESDETLQVLVRKWNVCSLESDETLQVLVRKWNVCSLESVHNIFDNLIMRLNSNSNVFCSRVIS